MKISDWILIVLIFATTTMIIWIIYSVNDLAKYQECIKDTTPVWCEI